MKSKTLVRRRTFLAIAGAGAAVAAGCGGRGPNTGGWRSFNDAEARCVDAICDQIIPADQDPGARAAGVVNFIDIQLAGRLRRHRRAYWAGIAALEKLSREKVNKAFADVPLEQQTEILQAFEENNREFFDLILTHTRLGFYGDPRHGGNRKMASWKMLGLPFPPLRGRQNYDLARSI